MHDFRGGGAEKVAVMLANEWLSQGYGTEIVCMSEAGPFRALVDDAVSVNCLSKRHAYDAILPLAALLRARRDAIVVAHLTHINVLSLLAGFMAGHPNVFVVEHNDFCRSRSDQPSMAAGIGYAVAPFLYARAQRVIWATELSFGFLTPRRARRSGRPPHDLQAGRRFLVPDSCIRGRAPIEAGSRACAGWLW